MSGAISTEEVGALDTLVEVRHLVKLFSSGAGRFGKRELLHAVDDVSFTIQRREVLGLVGESGCGKTTCGKVLIRILDPTDGRILFDGEDITDLRGNDLLTYRRRMMIIYQDPYGSLDPRMTVGRAIAEPMEVHGTLETKKDRLERTADLMSMVGLSPDYMNRYPHEFSGGQRQRIGIARALSTSPDFIVADEPVSALDVSIQAQIINLLQDLQRELGITLLFVSHDLSVVRHISDRVVVMYLGKIFETASKRSIFEDPKHPYTRALLSAIPVPDPAERRRGKILTGDVPSPIDVPPGCRFHPRCPHRFEPCDGEIPRLREVGPDHFAACYLYE
jgi:oligopeptide/dipeptide ABC transporter ATP-binding protein